MKIGHQNNKKVKDLVNHITPGIHQMVKDTLEILHHCHCMKIVRIRSYLVRIFPAFSCIRTACGEICVLEDF